VVALVADTGALRTLAADMSAEGPRMFVALVACVFRVLASELREVATPISVPHVFTDPKPAI
jgi:hypothetical protein